MTEKMQYVPWRFIADWQCVACGECCKLYSVVINFNEWLKIVKTYGVEQTVPGISKLFIRRKEDGSCTFLDNFSNKYACGIQYMKPAACQLWPFKILARPEYGYPNEAAYPIFGKLLFVYGDPMCKGIRYGTPTSEFANYTLREFLELSLGIRNKQHRTTSDIRAPMLHGNRWNLSRSY
ncbi:MAG: YkgJ family cysteine cluster protein [Candidatus Bathyarchaeia archaeon]